jgi:hypothetical protein
MFVPIAFESVNSPAQLGRGSFSACCSVYSGADRRTQVHMIEYTSVDGGASACEAFGGRGAGADGPTRARDFLWSSAHGWRDSDGECSDDLSALLPPELLLLRLVDRMVLGTVHSEESP